MIMCGPQKPTSASLHDSGADIVVHDVEAEVAGAATPDQHLSPVGVIVAGAATHRTGVESCDKESESI